MKHLIVFTLFTILACCSCSTSRISNLASRIAIDTIYISNVQYDSIYINRSSDIDRTRDTVTITKTLTEYRYKMLRDTIYKTKVDSIPYEVTITEVKEVTRALTWFDHLTRAVFFILCGILILKIYGLIHG